MWLLFAVLRCRFWAYWIPTDANVSDAFSRPDEPAKRQEAYEISWALWLQEATVAFPSSILSDIEAWTATLGHPSPGKP